MGADDLCARRVAGNEGSRDRSAAQAPPRRGSADTSSALLNNRKKSPLEPPPKKFRAFLCASGRSGDGAGEDQVTVGDFRRRPGSPATISSRKGPCHVFQLPQP